MHLCLKIEVFISDLHKALHSCKITIFSIHSNWANKKKITSSYKLLCPKPPLLLEGVEWHNSRISAEAEGQNHYKQLKKS